jgi:cellulose synthase/poly-beta-1,6-N-acetylglucosamine synthase-like glycosyltransferase
MGTSTKAAERPVSAPRPAPPVRWRVYALPLFLVRLAAVFWILAGLLRSSIEAPVIGLVLSAGVGGLLAASLVRWIFLFLMADPESPAPEQGLRVAVVTTFVPQAESIGMLERTVLAMTKLDYPHDTWVLDEGNDQDVIDLCGRIGAYHFSRRDMADYQRDAGPFRSGTKHGNYNAWLHEAGFRRYEILAGIDPDQVPYPDFLTATLGQFRDPKVAYVQSPQDYYNADSSLIARGCDEESRDFYWITQRAYHRFGSPSVIGAHHIHRMAALEKTGGLAPHVADDLLLTLLYKLSGWRGAYIPRVLARGLAPVDWATYIKQQRRWARSLLDVKFRIFPRISANMPISVRAVGIFQGLTYLQDVMVAICLLVALTGGLIYGVPASLSSFFLSSSFTLSLVLLLATGLYPHLYHGPRGRKGFYWRSAWLRFAKWPFTLQAIWDVARGGSHGYDLTVKSGPRPVRKLLFWPHLLLSALLIFALLTGIAVRGSGDFLSHLLAGSFVLASVVLFISNLLPVQPACEPTSNCSADERS